MKKNLFISSAVLALSGLTLLSACANFSIPVGEVSSYEHKTVLSSEEIYSDLQKVADWQLKSYSKEQNIFTGYEMQDRMLPMDETNNPHGWVYASLHVGFSRWAMLADSQGDKKYINWLKQVAERNKYLPAPRIYNADDYAIGQLYLDLYEKYQDEKMLEPLKMIFEIILSSPSTADLRFERFETKSEFTGKPVADLFNGRKSAIVPCKNRWCWADALFMGPPVWMHLASVTGDKRYLEFADKEFWETIDLLWDEEDHLFFRDSRFYDRREANGEKIIWARGVGWVAAGMARILEYLPKDHARRFDYEDIFRKMMTRLAATQQEDGLWRPSVLYPQSKPFKETSGTALMAFAYASGVNQGVLNRDTFYPVLSKAWIALVDAVDEDGKLGWVQQIGHEPDNVSEKDTHLYAVGAFLATGAELHKLLAADD